MKRVATVLSAIVAGNILSAEWTLDGSTEWIGSSSVKILQAAASGERQHSQSVTYSFGYRYNHYRFDYHPDETSDVFGLPEDVEDSMHGTDLGLEMEKGKNRLGLVVSLYKGFRNYNSIWIDRYYRQQYGNGGIPGVEYTTPDPKGAGLTVSYRREVIPSSGFLTFSAGFLKDEVAPGYEIDDLGNAFALIKSEDQLDTWTAALEWEGIIGSRTRTRNSIRATRTTDRETRFSWNGDAYALLSDRWISRSSGSYAQEDPDFRAWSIAQTIEYTLDDNWSISATVRYYEDTGQIESANLISSAAPKLQTKQAYLSVRYDADDKQSGFSLSLGPYMTDYGKTGIGTQRFVNLYRDRDWLWTRIGFRKVF